MHKNNIIRGLLSFQLFREAHPDTYSWQMECASSHQRYTQLLLPKAAGPYLRLMLRMTIIVLLALVFRTSIID